MRTYFPPLPVLAAFGVAEPALLEGGQGTAWLAGDLILKPFDVTEAELEWQAELLSSISCDGFRVARPKRAQDGTLVVGGWCAWERVEGRHEEGRWTEIIAVGERFHAALVGAPRPSFLARRTHPWAIGDRVAWGELSADGFVHVKHLRRLARALCPVEAPSQLIHGDLTGNVLFADGAAPAIIDLSPYWRPAAFASAIVVADALIWERADEDILGSVEHIEQFDQLLLRALIYRAVADRLFRLREPVRTDDADPYVMPVRLACRLAGAA